ncbi:phage tail tip lysozyme [Methylobacterium sp. NPDC080182]|uniref:phage tail tip lysozyme n=1 Tax=Methylobacterium sp. NPDC080182 TaxID=3390590 RepID=UPI003D04B503
MATVIDSLIVSLGLDPSGFTKGQKEAAASIAKTREQAQKHGAGIEKSMDGAAEAVDRLARNALKLFAVFTAGRAIKDFVADVTSADAALGRLAKSVGSTPDVISSLGNAVARNGGSATAAAGSFERLADSINEIKVTGNSSILPFLYRLQGLGGKQINLNKELSETFGDLAENAKNIADKSGVPFATYLLKQAGVDRDTAALLVKGREAYNKALAESRRIGIVRKEDTEAAQKLETSLESLRQTSEGFGRTILTAITPTVTDLIERMREWVTANQDWIKTEIVAKVREFADWLKSIDWNSILSGIRGFIRGADDAAKAVGGWKVVAEAFFALWAASKMAALFAPLLLQIAGVRLALLGLGPFGAALLGLGALGGAAALATADQLPKVLGRDGAAGVDPATGGATERPTMDLYGREGGARPWLRRQWNRTKSFFGGGDGVHRRASLKPYSGKSGVGSWWTPERQQHAIDRLKAGGVSEIGARALVARWAAVEAPQGPASVNPKSGAFGIGQWLGSRKPGINGNTDFDAQIDYALKELKGPEGKALRQLNSAQTNAEAATGASMFERAENYNPRTGQDDWTGKTAAAMDKLVGATKQAATGGKDDGSPEPTDGKGVNGDLMRVIKRAQEISEVKFHVHEGLRSVERQADMVRRGWSKTMNSKHLTGRAVDLRADGDPAVGNLDAAKYAKINEAIGKASKEAGVPVEWGGNWKGFKDIPHFQLPDDYKSNAAPYGGDPAKVSALQAQKAGAMAAIDQARAAQAATVSNTANDNRSTSSVENNIGAIHIQTAATDASGIARDIKPALQRHAFAAAANYARA